MKAILRSVAIFALIAAAKAEIIEYSTHEDRQTKKYYKMDPYPIPTTVINADMKRISGKITEDERNMVNLFSESQPEEEGDNHQICKNKLGVDLNNGESVFCDLKQISLMAAETRPGGHMLTFRMGFQPRNDKTFTLDISIYKKPSQYESDDKLKEFEEWATTTKVGILPPFKDNELEFLAHGENVTVEFNWLKELLRLGVYKSAYRTLYTSIDGKIIEEDLYFSRPLVLAEKITKKLLFLIYSTPAEPWPYVPAVEGR